MSPTVSASRLQNADFESNPVTENDFEVSDGYADGQSIDPDVVTEIWKMEVGEDGSAASYRFVRVGDDLDPTGNSAQGKLFVDLQQGDATQVPENTEFRIVSRPKNQNTRTALTRWFRQRDLDKSDTRQRQPLPKATVDGNPAFVPEGRVVAIEVRNTAESFNVDKTNSEVHIPARMGW